MSNRPLSMNHEAVRKRAYREKKRLEALAASAPPSAPVTPAPQPPARDFLPPDPGRVVVDPVVHVVTPPQTSGLVAQVQSMTFAPPPAMVQGHRVVEAPLPSAPTVAPELLATEVVQGPGAESFARPTLLDLGVEFGGSSDPADLDDEDDRDAVEREFAPRLVDPPSPPQPEQTTPEEAAMLASLVGAYCVFGWGLLASKHEEKLGALAETVGALVSKAKPELRAVLSSMSPRDKFQAGLAMLGGVVEESTARVLVKYNVRIPWQDELVTGTGIGTATFGIVQAIREPAAPTQPQPQQHAQPSANDNAPPPRAQRSAPSSWSSRPQAQPQDIEDADIVIGDDDGPPRNMEAWT